MDSLNIIFDILSENFSHSLEKNLTDDKTDVSTGRKKKGLIQQVEKYLFDRLGVTGTFLFKFDTRNLKKCYTFKEGYCKELNTCLWTLPSEYSYRISFINCTKALGKTVSTFVDNSYILMQINRNMLSKNTDAEGEAMMLLLCSLVLYKRYKGGNSKITLGNFVRLVFTNYFDRIESGVFCKNVLETVCSNLKAVYRRKTVTVGTCDPNKKRSVSAGISDEMESFVRTALAEGKSVRKLQSEFESLFGRTVSAGYISKQKKLFFS